MRYFLRALAVSVARRRWLPYKTRRSIIKKLCPAMLRDFAFEAPYFDPALRLTFSGNIVNYIDRVVYFCGAHEKYMLCFLRDYVTRFRERHPGEALTFIDIGANAGNHALFMSRLVERVIAFEPFARVREQLKHNITRNGITNITVIDVGLSHENATLPFYAAPESNLGAASFSPSHKQDNYYLGDMRLRRGDEALAELGARAHIIKADIEGYEKFALMGLAETLKRDRPLVIIELSPTTRETIGNAQNLQSLFPESYAFYYFARGSNDSGAYRLEPFDYRLTPKIQDVIACPVESCNNL